MRYLVTALPTRKLISATYFKMSVEVINHEQALEWLVKAPFKSLLWHETTRVVAETVLGRSLEKLTRREAGRVAVERGDELLISEYTGPDISKGETKLPDGGRVRWLIVKIWD